MTIKKLTLRLSFIMSKELLLAASYDLKVHAFDVASGNLVDQFEIANSQANRIIVPPSEHRFYIAAYSYIFSFDLELKTKKPIQAIPAHESNVTDICVTPDGNGLISCGEDKTIKLWDRRTGQQQKTLITKDVLNTMVLLPNAHNIIVGGESGQISIWDIRNSSCLSTDTIVKSPVRSISLAPNGSCIVAAYMNGLAVNFDMKDISLTEKYRIQAHNETQLRCVISPDSKMFATSSGDNSTKLWNLENGELKHTLIASDEKDWIFDVSFTADSTRVCTGGSDGICRVWDVRNGRPLVAMNQVEKCVSGIAVWSK